MEETPQNKILSSLGSGNELELCEHCREIFAHKNTYKHLASPAGLNYKRLGRSFLWSALDGCRLCRELLCMPYDYRPNGFMHIRPNIFEDPLRPVEWPMKMWAAVREKNHEPQMYRWSDRWFNHWFYQPDCELHFRMTGDLRYQYYIEVLQNQRIARIRRNEKLLFQIMACKGMVL
jgi:hypothetical protein